MELNFYSGVSKILSKTYRKIYLILEKLTYINLIYHLYKNSLHYLLVALSS